MSTAEQRPTILSALLSKLKTNDVIIVTESISEAYTLLKFIAKDIPEDMKDMIKITNRRISPKFLSYEARILSISESNIMDGLNGEVYYSFPIMKNISIRIGEEPKPLRELNKPEIVKAIEAAKIIKSFCMSRRGCFEDCSSDCPIKELCLNEPYLWEV